MIWDRTIKDANEARAIRRLLQNQQSLTENQIRALERGTITINTLNRIERKQSELKTLLNEAGYWNAPIVTTEWTKDDKFNVEDLKKIITETSDLRNAFFVFQDTPETPTPEYHYANINALEKILFDLQEMITDMKRRYRRCGTFKCGG